MEVKMQTSFIPKKPIVESESTGGGVSLFLLLSIILFIVVIAMAGGIWLWRVALISQIDKDKQSLVDARNKYEEEGTITSLIRFDDRIEEAKKLLSKHLTIIPVFVLLEENIIKNVQLKSLKFAYGGENKIKIDLTGTAKNYDALSKQSEAFGEDPARQVISEPVISDFNLNPDGTIAFNFNALLNSELVSYEKINSELINNLNDFSTTTLPIE
jgi:hypothetical protein